MARFDPTYTSTGWFVTRFIYWGSILLMRFGNRVRFHGAERLREARSRGRGLLTFSNHVSLFDDPWLTACLCTPDRNDWRWIAADALNFFGGDVRAVLFNAGKCVPVIRGAGLDQPGMDFLAERLEAGEWVHVFPEGGRTRSPLARLRTPMKPGLAHLVRRSRPLLLPFYHVGMQAVLPIGSLVPRIGRSISVHFGDCVDSVPELADGSLEAITEWVERTLLAMETEIRGPAPEGCGSPSGCGAPAEATAAEPP